MKRCTDHKGLKHIAWLWLLVGPVMAFTLTGCRNADVVGLIGAGATIGSAVSMDESDEDELGRSVVIAATNQWRVFNDQRTTRYLQLVAITVASASKNQDMRPVVGIVDTPEIGAFSGPGGYILITRGALNLMEDESELAGVIAHELCHILNHDGLKAVKNAKITQGLVKAAGSMDRRQADFNQGAGSLVETVLKSGWNQDQETDADKGAVKLLKGSGYDPRGLPRFLARMERQKSHSRSAFSTHPGTGDRIRRLTDLIGPQPTGATNPARFANYASPAKLSARF